MQHHTQALWHQITLFMTSKLLYLTSHPLYLTAHQLYLCHHTQINHSYNPHCMYDITATICMTSYELHMTSHPLFMISHHAMSSQPLYSCHHTQYIWHHIHCSCIITHSVLIIGHLLYVWHQTHYMYDIVWKLYDITPRVFMT